MLKIVIADDEFPSRQELRAFYWKLTAIWRSLLNVNMERQYLIIFQTILLTLFF